MISLESIRGFFPEELRAGQFAKHILKEYVECLALEWIARSPWAAKLTFIGGTNLRLTKDIDRFSEDLDFDCKGLAFDEDLALEILKQPEVIISVNMNEGTASATCWGCDLTYDYVQINGDYRT